MKREKELKKKKKKERKQPFDAHNPFQISSSEKRVGLLEPPTDPKKEERRQRERETHGHAWCWQVRSWVALVLVLGGKRWWVEFLAEESIMYNRQDGASNVDEDNRATQRLFFFSSPFFRRKESTHIYPCVLFSIFLLSVCVCARVSSAMKMKEADRRLYLITDAHDNNKNFP